MQQNERTAIELAVLEHLAAIKGHIVTRKQLNPKAELLKTVPVSE